MQRRTLLQSGLACVVGSVPNTPMVVLAQPKRKQRIFIVSSYHRAYLWSLSTQKGIGAALLKYGYIDNESQARQLASNDATESSRAVIRKDWMDTKRKDSRADMASATARFCCNPLTRPWSCPAQTFRRKRL